MSSFLKNWPVKVLGGRFLSVRDPLPPMTSYSPPPYTVYVTYTREGGGGELTREKVSGTNAPQSRSKIPTWLTVSPVYKLC